jgi:peptidyl-prolyl cis-trans isomerase SurA
VALQRSLARLRRTGFAVTAGLVTLVAGAVPARATIVERVVAVIGERPILWTELVHRAIAGRVQIRTQTQDPNVISVQEQEMYKELLNRMIDDRLEEQQADRAHLGATQDEIERGIANIASQAQAQQGRSLSVADVLEEVRRRGLTEQDFRDEIRRQILEGKLIELRVRPRVRVTEQDAHASYQHWVQEMRDQEPIDVRILALRVAPTLTKLQADARSLLAEELTRRARAGEDFCTLVSQYSDDVATRDSCGSHGAQPLSSLLPSIQEAVRAMKPGAVSDPIGVTTGQEQAIVIVMPMGQSKTPSYDEVKNEMMQRALLEGLERARKQWLQELRRSVYIDIRL